MVRHGEESRLLVSGSCVHMRGWLDKDFCAIAIDLLWVYRNATLKFLKNTRMKKGQTIRVRHSQYSHQIKSGIRIDLCIFKHTTLNHQKIRASIENRNLHMQGSPHVGSELTNLQEPYFRVVRVASVMSEKIIILPSFKIEPRTVPNLPSFPVPFLPPYILQQCLVFLEE